MAKRKKIHIKDVTDKWKKCAKPGPGIIEISDYTVAKSGNRFDKNNSKLKKPSAIDIEIGTWFKNMIWGDTVLQRGIDSPQNEPSADLLVLNECPFIKEQTIEIKTIPYTSRSDGIVTAIKSAKKQSSNILFDMSGGKFSEEFVIKEIQSNMEKHDWIQIIILKNKNSLIIVYSK